MTNNHSFASEFETILRAANALDPDLQNWHFAGLEVTNVAEGRYQPANQFWFPNRQDLIAVARRTIELRAPRWDGTKVRAPIEEWQAELKQRFGLQVYPGVGAGWRDLLWATLEISGADGRRVVDIKSKFGGLRIYAIGGDFGLIAESLSSRICERCGAPGRIINDGGWYRAACDQHDKKTLE